ncbi:MAG: alpha/beta fold hydrolase [Steroidobacteraceae bacterium]|nr:alpha/beta fold hydrolase [Steroidobacteraceae bacterium]MCC7200619.1 alpha/beta fold hydrolase [Gammaproteobacteria bacterium]
MLMPRFPTRVPQLHTMIRCGDRHVHARIAGSGPALVALHESPRSSLSLLPLMDALADDFTVIALDTPGYGYSDPLPSARPEMPEFVEALGQVLDVLGLERPAIYGTHTGAAIAAAFALARPQRVSALVLDGFAAFDAEEQVDFADRYLAPFEAEWDGSHLARLWSRCRDLFMWFPYHHRDAAHRLQTELPSVEAVYATVRGFLQAGSAYWKGYRCAGALDAPAAARALTVPTLVTARPHDLIAAHLVRVEPTASVEVRALGPSPEDWASAIKSHLARHGSGERATMPPGVRPRFVAHGDGALHLRWIEGDERIAVVLPDLPTAARDVEVPEALRDGRTLLIIDAPGCGMSDPLAGPATSIGDWLAPISAALTHCGIDAYDVIGLGRGALLAKALEQHDQRVTGMTVIDAPAWFADPGATPVEPLLLKPWPDPDGGSLLSTWYRLRDLAFYESVTNGVPRDRRPQAREDIPALRAAHAGLWMGPESADLVAALQAWQRR